MTAGLQQGSLLASATVLAAAVLRHSKSRSLSALAAVIATLIGA